MKLYQHFKYLPCRIPTLFRTLFKAADTTFLLVGGNDINLLNISNTLPTDIFSMTMQPKKCIYFSKVV